MPARLAAARPVPRPASVSIDVTVVTPAKRGLAALLVRGGRGARSRWALPWDGPRRGEPLDAAAHRIARSALGREPAWLEQVGGETGGRHPGGAELSIGFFALVPGDAPGAAAPSGAEWFPAGDPPPLAPRHRTLLAAAAAAVRARIDYSPVAFSLLPPTFTLSELQEIYELLLARRLHKASFRRALQAAWLVEPTDEWRSEGRGRPAQLFRYAPRRRRGGRRAVRFDLLGA
jgi:8-oxo-dGTP diphosphatase